ncbi:hypothetical protein NST69_27505 [Paenibacillus sp. FSL P2-0089]|uniref:hypothetical protein n=1 Tax=Paenibacillus sp. FSL P2-0089 TaxID=2954526 RepID=UPI00315AF466
MKTTGNLGLKKPDGTDIVDINDLNGNMDILDTTVKAAQDHAADTTKHVTAVERTAWNAKAPLVDIGAQSAWGAGNGWRRIAESTAGVVKRQTTMIIDWSNTGGASGQTIFVVSINDNVSPVITQIVASSTASNQGLVQARVVYHPITKGNAAFIEVFKAGVALVNFTVKLLNPEGWTPTISSVPAVIPTDYTSVILTFTNGGVATTGPITTTYTDGPPLKVSSALVVTGMNVEKLGGSDLPTVAMGTLAYAVTAGTATAYTASYAAAPAVLSAGLRLTFKAHVASGSNPTFNPSSLGAKPIKKLNGNAATLALNGVYTVVYDGVNFILQGEGGEYGTATAAQVIEGYSLGTEEGLKSGTLEDSRGEEVESVSWLNDDGYLTVGIRGGGPQAIDADTRFQTAEYIFSKSILANEYILGVAGTATSDATATSADIAANKSAYVNGVKVWGTFSTADATAVAADIKTGKTAYVNGNKVTGTAGVYRTLSQLGSVQVAPSTPLVISIANFATITGAAFYSDTNYSPMGSWTLAGDGNPIVMNTGQCAINVNLTAKTVTFTNTYSVGMSGSWTIKGTSI